MPNAAPRAKTWWLGLNFAFTIFVSAFLLFQVQPLISKFILPWFGGSPAVWTTCMLFFQSLLFAGYAYAHFSVKWLSPARQAIVHAVLLVAALAVTLPSIAPSSRWKPAGSEHPQWNIMLLLAANVGLPYFLLSSTGPLLQAWFARSFPGRSPYRLYALSNVGSLLALVSYPFLVEPAIDSFRQSSAWSWGFALFVILCGYAAIHIWNIGRAEAAEAATSGAARAELAKTAAEQPPAWYQPVLWMVLPAFASMMLLATTNHVCLDVSPSPFLWVVPLSLYLLSFIISFDHERWYVRPFFAVAGLVLVFCSAAAPRFSPQYDPHKTPVVEVAEEDLDKPDEEDRPRDPGVPKVKILGFVAHQVELYRYRKVAAKDPDSTPQEADYEFSPNLDYVGELVIHFAALFCMCMICHGELVRIRPAPRYLTLFYLMISAGGALGGIFVSLVAPKIFNTYYEWVLGLFGGVILTAATFVLSTGIFQHFDDVAGPAPRERGWSLARWSVMLLLFAVPWLILSGIAWSDLSKMLNPKDEDETSKTIARARNFYGAIRIEEDYKKDADPENEGPYIRTLYNGRIIHGTQFLDADKTVPTTYYSTDSGVGRAIGFFRAEPNLRVGAVGLGTGTLAAYCTEPGHYFRFYEINPKVEELSNEFFTYRKNAKGKVDIILGDARLSLEREAEEGSQRFDVLVLDAFSGDAIPTHLLTREAFEIYLKHVDIRHGIIAVHISNRYLDLIPVVRGLTEHFKLGSIRIHTSGQGRGGYSSEWICVTNNVDFIGAYQADDEYDTKSWPSFMFYAGQEKPQAAFQTLRQWPRSILWTDAHSNLFEILMGKEED